MIFTLVNVYIGNASYSLLLEKFQGLHVCMYFLFIFIHMGRQLSRDVNLNKIAFEFYSRRDWEMVVLLTFSRKNKIINWGRIKTVNKKFDNPWIHTMSCFDKTKFFRLCLREAFIKKKRWHLSSEGKGGPKILNLSSF